jgi:hypothetical protein
LKMSVLAKLGIRRLTSEQMSAEHFVLMT